MVEHPLGSSLLPDPEYAASRNGKGCSFSSLEVQYKGQISTHSEQSIPFDLPYKAARWRWRQPECGSSLLADIAWLTCGRMKLLALCAFLFVCLLCLNAFTVEGTVYPLHTIVSFLYFAYSQFSRFLKLKGVTFRVTCSDLMFVNLGDLPWLFHGVYFTRDGENKYEIRKNK